MRAKLGSLNAVNVNIGGEITNYMLKNGKG